LAGFQPNIAWLQVYVTPVQRTNPGLRLPVKNATGSMTLSQPEMI
jgi:hypothetical protein